MQNCFSKLKKNVFIFVMLFFGFFPKKTFAQTAGNEQKLSAILDTLDNPFYWKTVPEDSWGIIPDEGYWKKYPHRVKLFMLRDSTNSLLNSPLSTPFLLSLLDKESARKLAFDYLIIADKIFDSSSENAKRVLLNYALLPDDSSANYTALNNMQFRPYVINECIQRELFKEVTRAYIVANNDFNTAYYNYFDKEIDLKIIENQISYLHAEMLKPELGDASRWAGYLFLESGLKPWRFCKVQSYRELFPTQDFQWETNNNEKNVNMVLRFLERIKNEYEMLNRSCRSENAGNKP
jgi:hypothetical protein